MTATALLCAPGRAACFAFGSHRLRYCVVQSWGPTRGRHAPSAACQPPTLHCQTLVASSPTRLACEVKGRGGHRRQGRVARVQQRQACDVKCLQQRRRRRHLLPKGGRGPGQQAGLCNLVHYRIKAQYSNPLLKPVVVHVSQPVALCKTGNQGTMQETPRILGISAHCIPSCKMSPTGVEPVTFCGLMHATCKADAITTTPGGHSNACAADPGR